MRRIIAMGTLGLAACATLFDLDVVPATHDDSGVTNDAIPAGCFADPFTTIDSAVWSTSIATGTTLAIDNEELFITLPSNSNRYATLGSLERDLTGYKVEVEMVAPPTEDGVEAFLRWSRDTENYYGMFINGPYLEIGTRAAGVYDFPQVGYSTLNHRYLQIAHDPFAKKMRFSTKATVGDWVVRREVDIVVPLDRLTIEIGAGTWKDVTAPGTARLDNAVICPRCSGAECVR